MAALGETYYRPFSDQLRMRTNDYTWGSQLAYLQADVDLINKLLSNTAESGHFKGIGHTPVRRAPIDGKISISAALFTEHGKEQVILHYRRKGEKKYRTQSMQFDRNLNIYRAEIESALTRKTGTIEYYLSADINGKTIFNPKQGNKKPIAVDISNDFSAPVLSHRFKGRKGHPQQIKITVKAVDKSGVKSVRLFYKALPAYLNWRSVAMKNTGGGNYEASVPLSARGLMYHFEALDTHGNGAVFPDPQKETPFFVIDAWEEK